MDDEPRVNDMNIMEIVSGGGVNGATMHCVLLTRELLLRGHQVTLVCPPHAWIADQLESSHVEKVTSDLQRWPLAELERIAAVARERRIDIVHTHMSRAHFFGVLLRWVGGFPSVATAHNRWIQAHWMFNDRVIAVSEAVRRFHRTYNLVRAARINVIHNFVDLERFTGVSEDARRSTRAALGIDESSPLVGTIGDVLPAKGTIFLVKALPEILAAVPDARLLIVGNGPQDHIARMKAEAGRLSVSRSIVWAGFRADVPAILAALDVFVLPSLRESFSLASAEAMAAGLPVVATAVGGLPECVIAGQTGILVPPGDPRAIAEAVISLLRDEQLRLRLGEAGRKRVTQLFSPERQVPRIEAVFERVLRERRPAGAFA